MKKRRKIHQRAKHFFLPHKGNKFRPGLFNKESVAAIAIALFLIEAAYLFQVKVMLENEGFTAAVLPSALTSLANADRTAYALSQLEVDPLLTQAAQAKADDMAAKSYFAHVAPDGSTFRTHLDAVGYDYTYAGENLAVDFDESVDVEKAWMNSPTHRANILKAEYTNVGYGVARGIYQGKEVTFVAQFFAAKRSTAPKIAAVEVPADVPATEPVIALNDTASPDDVQVLGEQIADQPIANDASVAVLATSPSKVVWYMLTAFTALVAVLFSVTVVAHLRNRFLYTEVILGGIAIMAIGASLLMYNGAGARHAVIPGETQAASVSALF